MEQRPAEGTPSGGPNKRRRKERLEIQLEEWAITPKTRFIPGTAPPQPPISLLPARDGDGFIIDKIIHPLGIITDPTVQRKLCYIVGWPDLPAARLIVSCAEAHEYLSPYAIEEWEYNDSLKREEEEWQKVMEESGLLAKSEEVPVPEEKQVKVEAGGKKKRKPGRPPRAARLAQEQPPTPALEEEEEELMRLNKAAGPSLSTPQKRRVEQLILEEETYDDPDEADILQQLYDEGGQLNTFDPMNLDSEEPFPSTNNLEPEVDDLGIGPSRPAGSAQYPPNGDILPRLQTPDPIVSDYKGKGPATAISTSASNTPVPIRRNDQTTLPYLPSSSLPQLNGAAAFAASAAASSSYASAASSPAPRAGSAALSLPSHDRVKGKPGRKPKAQTPQPAAAPPATASSGLTHAAAPEAPKQTWGFTPIKAPVTSTPTQSYTQPSSSNLQRQTANETPSSSKPPKSSKKKKTPKQPPPEAELPTQAPPEAEVAAEGEAAAKEEDYEVLRLEGDRLVDMPDGSKVQFFKVRWKGEWPPDQNPTWEPEENIVSKSIVRSYLKKKAKKAAAKSSTPKKSSQKTLSNWVIGPKYSSVMDAVEGLDEVEQAERSFARPADDDEDELNGGMEEELRVTDAPPSSLLRRSTNGSR